MSWAQPWERAAAVPGVCRNTEEPAARFSAEGERLSRKVGIQVVVAPPAVSLKNVQRGHGGDRCRIVDHQHGRPTLAVSDLGDHFLLSEYAGHRKQSCQNQVAQNRLHLYAFLRCLSIVI